MKRLAVITGSRAEYGVLRPFLRLARQSTAFELQLIVAGMHLSKEYGETWREIEADGIPIAARIAMTPHADLPAVAAWWVGEGMQRFSWEFDALRPDLVLVEGDRVEVLAATLAAGYMGIPVAHSGGGCLTRTIDNAARHAISHFASLHFVETADARERLVRMGCESSAVHVTGALGVDAIMQTEFLPREAVLDDLGLPAGVRYLLVVFHPESERVDRAGDDMENVLRACLGSGLPVVVIYPNSDPGSTAIIDAILRFPAIRFRSLSSARYLNALKHADALVGNSSSGLLEAPSLGVFAVNVGHRQDGRLKGWNVLDCGYREHEIQETIYKVLTAEPSQGMQVREWPLESSYGDGHAAQRMMAVIEGRFK